MIKDFKIWWKKFLRGSHNQINGYNIMIILVMFLVLTYHIALNNKQSGHNKTLASKNNSQKDFFRYPASEKQNLSRKARQAGYINYTTAQNKDGTWNIQASVEGFKSKDLKFKWHLKKNIEKISGVISGFIDTKNNEFISINVKATDLNDYLLVLEVLDASSKMRIGQQQAIRLMHSENMTPGESAEEQQLMKAKNELSKEEFIDLQLKQNVPSKIKQ